MGRNAIELLIEGAVLVQNAVKDISRNPPRRQAGRFSGQSESLRGHFSDTSCLLAQQPAFQSTLAAAGIALTSKLALEYANCKNPPCDLTSRKWRAAMTNDPSQTDSPSKPDSAAPSRERELPPAAQRALAEADARRKAMAAEAASRPKEFQGPKGPEPTRYGDWEKKGLISDF